MKKKNIEEIIEDFFKNPKNITDLVWNFSSNWKKDVKSKVLTKADKNSTEKKIRFIIKKVHETKFNKDLIQKFTELNTASLSSKLLSDGVEDIVREIIVDKLIKEEEYDPGYGNGTIEETFLSTCINNKLIDSYRKPYRKRRGETSTDYNPYDDDNDLKHTEIDDDKIRYIRSLVEDKNAGNQNVDLNRVLNYLCISDPNVVENIFTDQHYKLNHILYNRNFLINNLPEGFKFIRDNEEYRNRIRGYARHEKIAQANERKHMIEAIKLLKECKNDFYSYLKNKSAKEKIDKIYNTPFVSAVAVDKNEKVIKKTFKGQKGSYDHHCEFDLFENMNNDERERLEGGSLFVTLEPCYERGSYTEDEVDKPKRPCAVRCLETGISNIFIGIHDPDDTVDWEGIKSLKNGTYTFTIDENNNPIPKKEKNKKGLKLLMEDFDDKGYNHEKKGDQLIFTLREKRNTNEDAINVIFFHPDLTKVILEINEKFLGERDETAYSRQD